jgi:hypothetical protein
MLAVRVVLGGGELLLLCVSTVGAGFVAGLFSRGR